jgi:predicted dienelactone hydrolase
MKLSIRQFTFTLFALLLSTQAAATQAGWRQINLPGASADAPPVPVALYYPTQAPARTVAMGPFRLEVAVQAPPDDTFKALIVMSHGNGGTELAHSSLAQALARQGYLVAALRHPGDNWQDRSLMQSASRYFTERPQQVSRVIDALLRDPQWRDHITTDAQGPRVGAVGHSAGGFTVLALAGAQSDPSLVKAHCQTDAAQDPIFCSLGRATPPSSDTQTPTPTPMPPLIDPRVRAVVAMAPVGAAFSAQALAKIRIPTVIYGAASDRFLVPRFHAEWVARHVPGAEVHHIPQAWHFAFMDAPTLPIPSADGDVAADPPGFDRPAFLQQLQQELPAFFDKVFR